MKRLFEFLTQLRSNNNREWFKAHKSEADMVMQLRYVLFDELRSLVAEVDARALELSEKDCVYRIYRDTRFSTDKSPYKTHIGIFINPPGGKKAYSAGYYFHLEPGACQIAAGTVCLPADIVKAIRTEIYENVDEYAAIVERRQFRKVLPQLGLNLLKTAPKGFDKHWEHIDYLKPRDFCAYGDVAEDVFCLENVRECLRPAVGEMKRYNDFINFAIEQMSDRTPLPVIY